VRRVPPEIALMAVIGVLIAAVGLPAIQRGIFLPREFSFETPPDDALTDRQRSHFQGLDAALGGIGYAPFLNFRVTNLQGGNLTRVYRSDYDAAVLAASFLKAHSTIDARVQTGQNYCEWVTRYEDGTTLAILLSRDAALLARLAPLLRLSPEACRWGLLGAGCTAGGAAVGWLFTAKSFVWALVLAAVRMSRELMV
jgi:hypothetical protein